MGTIDVTDCVQSMIVHRGQSGGYLEIEDGYDKSLLDGFYDVNPDKIKWLEIEYMFNRRYHYVRVTNLEYLCIPSQAHVVQIFDPKGSHTNSQRDLNLYNGDAFHESDSETYDDEKTQSLVVKANDSNILHSALSFSTFSPVSMQNVTEEKTFFGQENAMKMTPDSPNNANVSRVIDLPSGKQAMQSRPSLAGLKKFSEIEQLRKEMDGSTESKHGNEGTSNNKGNNGYIKWSVGLIVVGAVGGFGYFYFEHRMNKKRNDGDNDRRGIIEYFWR